MNVIDRSLYRTVMNAAGHLFLGGTLTPVERDGLVSWILAHQNRRHGFSFYPTVLERAHGIRLLSGEKPQTVLATENAVEMETLRLLALLCPNTPEVRCLFERAERRLSGVCYGRVCSKGECAHASISVLRYHTARGVERGVSTIERGLEALQQARIDKGQWQSFPFYYTLLWLIELPDGLTSGDLYGRVRAELSHTQGRCLRLLSRPKLRTGKPFVRVRIKILQDALFKGTGTVATQALMFEAVG